MVLQAFRPPDSILEGYYYTDCLWKGDGETSLDLRKRGRLQDRPVPRSQTETSRDHTNTHTVPKNTFVLMYIYLYLYINTCTPTERYINTNGTWKVDDTWMDGRSFMEGEEEPTLPIEIILLKFEQSEKKTFKK